MTKTKPALPPEALIIDCSENVEASKAKTAIYDDLARATKADDVDGIKTATRALERILQSENPRESRVALTDDEHERHLAEQASAHKDGLLWRIQNGLAATDPQVVAALENGSAVPKPLAQHRAALRAAAAAAEKAKSLDELDAIEIPAPLAH